MNPQLNSLSIRGPFLLSLLFTLGFLHISWAETVTLEPAKDNSIYSESNNSNGEGNLFSGRTLGRQAAGKRRALIQFDLTGSVPSGATIESVSLTMSVNRRGSVSVGSTVNTFLHRLNQDWGEGSSGGSGMGDSPSPGDATWNFTFFDTESWNFRGGDFVTAPSAIQPMSTTGPITWSSPTLVSDVQAWVDNPDQNFGWILIVDEGIAGAATIFESREDTLARSRPQLTIDFSANGEPPGEQDLVLEGSGDVVGEDILHPSGNIFDQVLLTGQSVKLRAKENQITRVSFLDENEDIVQVEFSGKGSFTVNLDPATFLPPAFPAKYNQQVLYVTGRPSVVIEGADANTFFSIFTVGRINAVNQALFPDGVVYDAQADVTLVEVINSTGIGGMQLSNTVFSANTGRTGVVAEGVPIAVRLTVVGDIDASGDAVAHLLFGTGSFTVPAGNPGLRITGGDLLQTNGASIVVAPSGSTTTGFEDTFISQNNFKSDNTPQPTLSINATFINEDDEEITVTVNEVTIE